MKASSILGLNARAQLFSYRYNRSKAKAVAASKLLMFKVMKKSDVPTPEIYAKFINPREISIYDWQGLPGSFVLKPSKGLGGRGIIVVKRRARDGNGWITTTRERVTVEDLKLHTLDILEGAYNLQNAPGAAMVQEYVARHKAFRKYAYRGTPDIRVIVFNKVPLMAMLRLPTKDSRGRANLHQGAIGVGVDIATGITTYAVHYANFIKHKPGTKRKLHGIKIPQWSKVLSVAIDASEASGLIFCGADIVLHPEKGPMVLELNYQPGFQIQLCNKAGLRKRLDRVEDLTVKDPEHGVKIARALFAAHFADRVKASGGIRTISALEEIVIRGKNKVKKRVVAKIDTGAWRTSVSKKLAEELGLLDESNILWTKKVKSSLGEEERPIISLRFKMAGRKITTPASVAKRMSLKYPVIIGRKDLKGYLVDPLLDPSDEKYKRTKS